MTTTATKLRVNQLSKELGLSNKDLIQFLEGLGADIKSHSSSVEPQHADKARQHFKSKTSSLASAMKAPINSNGAKITPKISAPEPDEEPGLAPVILRKATPKPQPLMKPIEKPVAPLAPTQSPVLASAADADSATLQGEQGNPSAPSSTPQVSPVEKAEKADPDVTTAQAAVSQTSVSPAPPSEKPAEVTTPAIEAEKLPEKQPDQKPSAYPTLRGQSPMPSQTSRYPAGNTSTSRASTPERAERAVPPAATRPTPSSAARNTGGSPGYGGYQQQGAGASGRSNPNDRNAPARNQGLAGGPSRAMGPGMGNSGPRRPELNRQEFRVVDPKAGAKSYSLQSQTPPGSPPSRMGLPGQLAGQGGLTGNAPGMPGNPSGIRPRPMGGMPGAGFAGGQAGLGMRSPASPGYPPRAPEGRRGSGFGVAPVAPNDVPTGERALERPKRHDEDRAKRDLENRLEAQRELARLKELAKGSGARPTGGSAKGRRGGSGGGHSVAVIEEKAPPEPEIIVPVRIDQPLTIRELAILLHKREPEIIKHLFMKGVMVTVNQVLEPGYAKSICQEFEVEVLEDEAKQDNEGAEYAPTTTEKKAQLDESSYQHLAKRPPVVSIMGHVDHGKTSLLDAIRETRIKVVEGEAGGITQSIGAYVVYREGQKVVFLDTPGHEAFTSMRMRGARATDIAILVVAADDGVMPQTIEAINHAKAAGIPIIVAVNKIDKAGADPEKVLVQLAEYGLVSEKWGGETVVVEVSALQKLGLEELLEMILLVSELQSLKADATVPGEGVIIEAQLDKRKGPVATALVQNGTLKIGDNVLIGSVGGRVRALISDLGERVSDAPPSTPVEILGLSEVPKAGDLFKVIRDDKVFKQMLEGEKLKDRNERMAQSVGARSQGFALRQDGGEQDAQKTYHVIVKADTQGSTEAVNAAILNLSTDEIQVKLIHSGTGDVSEADVMLATASHATIIAFNVKEDANAARIAEQAGIEIKPFDVIYHVTEAMEKWMLGKLAPDTAEVETGSAEVRQLFTVGKNTVIAGCMVTKGKLLRNAKAKVTRGGAEVFTGTLDNLKRFKDDAKEVAAGYECGISFSKFNDLQEGDIITIFTIEETERTSL